MTAPIDYDESEIVAVLDSNVVLDIVSCHDFVAAVESPLDLERLRYRVQRAAEAARLAIYLHKAGALTICHFHEAMRILAREAPRSEPLLQTAHVQLFISFVRDQLLPGWRDCMPRNPRFAQLKSDEADDALISLAKAYRRPLISNEGRNSRGIDGRKRIRWRSVEAGVEVLTPAEFYSGKLEESEVDHFLYEFLRLAPHYHCGEVDYDNAQYVLGLMYGYYRYVLKS